MIIIILWEAYGEGKGKLEENEDWREREGVDWEVRWQKEENNEIVFTGNRWKIHKMLTVKNWGFERPKILLTGTFLLKNDFFKSNLKI